MKLTRRIVQAGFLGLVLVGVFALGANCERWCPFGGVEAIYTYTTEGNMLCSLSTSNFFMLGGLLLTTLLLRRAFCGYVCPIGTISEWLHAVGRRLHLPNVRVGPKADRILAALKYVVLVVILAATWQAGELVFRGYDPCYALISRHGTDITHWAYVVSGTIALASLFAVVPFCRWFCPLAAVLNPLSRFGLARVRRNKEACIDCGLCSENCPAAIPVDQLEQVTAARCISCLNCIDSCPVKGADAAALSWSPPGLPVRRWSQAVLIAILITCTTATVAASYMFPLPSFVKSRGERPDQVAEVELKIENLTCRGRGNLFFYFLERDDSFEIPGYLKVEAWPGPGLAEVEISYDPSATDETAITEAITEPYFEPANNFWRMSPFVVEGYDPLGLGG